jgi:Predicted permeases
LASTAGLASLVSYPALLAVGLPPVIANVTNTTSLIFTGIGSTVSSLRELRGHWRQLTLYVSLALVGGIIGSLALILAPESSFEKIVPFLIFLAGALLISSGRQTGDTAQRIKAAKMHPKKHAIIQVTSYFGILFVGAYGGYFGAGAGILILSLLSIITDDDFLVVNAMKNVIGFASNLIATIVFIFRTRIAWHFVIPMGIGLFIGGYVGPIIVRHINITILRALIALAAFGLGITLFIKAYF